MTKLSTNSGLTEFLFFLIALLYFLPTASAKKNSVSATSSASWAFSSTALSFDYLLEVLPLLLLCPTGTSRAAWFATLHRKLSRCVCTFHLCISQPVVNLMFKGKKRLSTSSNHSSPVGFSSLSSNEWYSRCANNSCVETYAISSSTVTIFFAEYIKSWMTDDYLRSLE